MGDNERGGKRDQLDDHSLPGTNQEGKLPGSCEESDKEHRSSDPDQLDDHSLPGTNQAGKGPGSREKDGQEETRKPRDTV